MAFFKNDYSVLAHENIIKALIDAKNEINNAYGKDKHTLAASQKICNIFGLDEGKVYFLSGGTQVNMVVISYFLRHYEGVIACNSAHINVHETASVEGSGHKIVCVNNKNGKLTAASIKKALYENNDPSKVKIKMVYISNATEMGTIYTKKELLDIKKVCLENDLLLFMDGARLANALTCKTNDIDCKFIGNICDIFYIGGTKNGLLSGEAVVIKNDKLNDYFNYHIKNKGALLAKGFVLGIQFEELFKNDLFFKLAKKANDMADFIKEGLIKINIQFAYPPTTNQLFIVLNNKVSDIIISEFGCEVFEEKNNSKVIRIVTSYATTKDECLELLNRLEELLIK